MTAATENYQFQAETQKLLNIIIHSIYTNKEIFLRELISNASDALDKVRFELSRGSEVADADQELRIDINVDKEGKTLTVADTGIGMNREEIVSDLGTIAKSGTEEFLKQVSEQEEHPDNIIGQFGVGFYSVFMVADRVRIRTRSARPEDRAVYWSSDGKGSFEVSELDEPLGRGTRIEIQLNEDSQDYLDPERIKNVIKKHSNFISFPIYVDGEKVNTIPALWKESKFTISQDQYDEFYKFLTLDTEGPLETIHISVDAPVQFNSLLFIPQKSTAMFENYLSDYGLDLYVHRVLIQRSNQELIPQYLGFVRGVVDTEDLPLNLSRQSIQESALIQKIRSTITKQVLSRLQEIASKEPERYTRFWREHGRVFKLGYSDFANRDKFSELLRFNSSRFEDKEGLTSLQEYLDRMPSGQKEIYFISGPSRENILNNPHLEMFTRKGVEVLFLFEPIDEFVLQALGTYRDYPLTSVEHADPSALEEFTDREEEGPETEELTQEEEKDLEQLLKKMQDILGDRVTEVRFSKRLKSSPACLVNPQSGVSSQMQKIMHMINKDESIPKQILEVNPRHPLSRNLLRVYRNDPEDPFITTATEQLFESSLLLAGYLPDPHSLVNRNFRLLQDASSWYAEANRL
jgi:molecular chaperone HtpG